MAATPAVARLILAACVTAACAPAREADPLPPRVDAYMEALVSAGEFSGAVVLSRQGAVVHQRGFGMANHEAGAPFTPDTPSDGGSMAKTFTAALIWWLAHEGRIDVDAPVARYVPEFPHRETTVRHLLVHSNGLPPYYEFFDAHFGPGEVRTTEALLRVVARQAPRPAFAPGSRFEYSNLGFDTAALVAERVTGRSFPELLEARFFARLGMTASFARPARLADWPGIRTLGYHREDGRPRIVDVFDMEAFLGASNVYFTAADLARWAAANAAGTALPPAVFAVGQPRGLIAGIPSPMTGLSWYCDEAGSRCYYTGTLNAFHCFAYWDRGRNESAAFASNSSLPPWKVIGLERELVAALAGRPTDAETAVRFERFDRDAWPGLAGTYQPPGAAPLTLAFADGRLTLRAGQGLAFEAFQVGPDVFYVPGPDYWVAFSGGPDRRVMHARSLFVDLLAPRVLAPRAGFSGRGASRASASETPGPS